jgi:hydroxymethylglutaryl-CoA lyase
MGWGTPDMVRRRVAAAREIFPKSEVSLHLHDTRGTGMANVYAGLLEGVRIFDSSVGGLGGCPFAPRAVGNICTEDFVHMVHEMGIETGIDLDALLGVAAYTQQDVVGRPLPGMVMKAGKASELHDKAAPKVKVD